MQAVEVDAATGTVVAPLVDDAAQQAVVANTTLLVVPATTAGLTSAANALTWLLDHTSWSSWPSAASEHRLAIAVAPMSNSPPPSHHRTGDVNADVATLLQLLPSVLLPPTTGTTPTGSSGRSCEGFRQAAETYRLALRGVAEGQWASVNELLQGLSKETATSSLFCRWKDYAALQKEVSDAAAAAARRSKDTAADTPYR